MLPEVVEVPPEADRVLRLPPLMLSEAVGVIADFPNGELTSGAADATHERTRPPLPRAEGEIQGGRSPDLAIRCG